MKTEFDFEMKHCLEDYKPYILGTNEGSIRQGLINFNKNCGGYYLFGTDTYEGRSYGVEDFWRDVKRFIDVCKDKLTFLNTGDVVELVNGDLFLIRHPKMDYFDKVPWDIRWDGDMKKFVTNENEYEEIEFIPLTENATRVKTTDYHANGKRHKTNSELDMNRHFLGDGELLKQFRDGEIDQDTFLKGLLPKWERFNEEVFSIFE